MAGFAALGHGEDAWRNVLEWKGFPGGELQHGLGKQPKVVRELLCVALTGHDYQQRFFASERQSGSHHSPSCRRHHEAPVQGDRGEGAPSISEGGECRRHGLGEGSPQPMAPVLVNQSRRRPMVSSALR